jgi:hypothetical protein
MIKLKLNPIHEARSTMAQNTVRHKIDARTAENDWKSLYCVAGIGVFLAVGLMLLDITLSFTGGDFKVGGLNSVDWFNQFQMNALLGLRNLGFFNVINPILILPLYLVIYQIHRKALPAFATLAWVLFLLGAGVYIANNRALSMLALSHQYAAAATDAQKSLIAAAGTVVLSQAEDFTPGSFMGFLISNTANILMMSVMIHVGTFDRKITWAGLVGSVGLLIFTICATFIPSIFGPAMIFALVGGLLSIVWYIFMALKMVQAGLSPTLHQEQEPELRWENAR